MATVTTLPDKRSGNLRDAHEEHRGLAYWMERVLKQLRKADATDEDAVHDLRVALRRCRSVAQVMGEVDPNPAWKKMRRVPRKLFRALGELRDAHVMKEWVAKLAPETDAGRMHLEKLLSERLPALEAEVTRTEAKFDRKAWKQLRKVRQRARIVPLQSSAAECLALERFLQARKLHRRAQRSEKAVAWHELRIGVKKLRYTVEGFLPEQEAAWIAGLKSMQDVLGEIHDLDVLSGEIMASGAALPVETHQQWGAILQNEREARVQKYRQMTQGSASLWTQWRQGLPSGRELEKASAARLSATAKATDPKRNKSLEVAKIAATIFQGLGKAGAGELFEGDTTLRILRAATMLQAAGTKKSEKRPEKSAKKLVMALAPPPGWSKEEWAAVGWSIRYHRGAEPTRETAKFVALSETQQQTVLAVAGVVRLARSLRKAGVTTGAGIEIQKAPAAIALYVPELLDSLENAERLAAGKHMLESLLGMPLVITAAKNEAIVNEPVNERELQFAALASD